MRIQAKTKKRLAEIQAWRAAGANNNDIMVRAMADWNLSQRGVEILLGKEAQWLQEQAPTAMALPAVNAEPDDGVFQYPQTKEELDQLYDDMLLSPAAKAQELFDVDKAIKEEVGVARLRAVEFRNKLANEVTPPATYHPEPVFLNVLQPDGSSVCNITGLPAPTDKPELLRNMVIALEMHDRGVIVLDEVMLPYARRCRKEAERIAGNVKKPAKKTKKKGGKK